MKELEEEILMLNEITGVNPGNKLKNLFTTVIWSWQQ